MKKIRYLVVALAMFTTFANAGEVRSKIDARIAELTAAWNSGDHEGVLAIYDKGFVIVPDQGEAVSDRDAWGETLAEEVQEYPNIKFKTTSLKVHGGYAFNIGVASFTVKVEDGDDTTGEIDYLLIWKKDDKDAWNIHLEIYWDTESPNARAQRTKIDARRAELTAAWNSGDHEGVLALYDEGFFVVPEIAEPMGDRDTFRKDLASEVVDYPNVNYDATTLKIHGNYAYEIGVDTYTIKGDDAKGKDDYLIVWKKDDKGVWNCHIDMWWGFESDE